MKEFFVNYKLDW